MSEKKKLSEICNILNGYAFKSKEYVDDGIRVIRITNVQKGIIEDFDPKYYDISQKDKLKNYMLKENDLLISLTGNVGRVGLMPKELLPAGLNQRVGCLRIKDIDNISIKYLYQYLNSDKFENECINNSNGIAQKNLSTEWLKDYIITVPSIEDQKKITNKLENIQKITKTKKEQIKELDELIKSQFVEMFGLDKYEQLPLSDCSNFIDYRGHTPEVSNIGDIRMINAKSVGKGVFKYIDEYVTEELKKFALGQRVITIQGNEMLNNVYLSTYMQLDEFMNKINQYKTGGTAQGIRSKDLAKITIPIPPIKLQNKFAEFVKQIDKQKFEIQKSLEKMQLLQKSMMNKYFG